MTVLQLEWNAKIGLRSDRETGETSKYSNSNKLGENKNTSKNEQKATRKCSNCVKTKVREAIVYKKNREKQTLSVLGDQLPKLVKSGHSLSD